MKWECRVITPLLILALSLNAAPSAATLAAVAIFRANVVRQWPTDERGPAVTVEALRLMERATRGIADDWHITDDKFRDSMADFESAWEALSRHAPGDKNRPALARDALDQGRTMIDLLAEALRDTGTPIKTGLSAMKESVEQFDRKQPVRQQVDVLERYFDQAAALLQSMLDAPPPSASPDSLL